MATQFPLREKRKAQTRANLIQAAMELFANNGYQETTLEQVAEKAGLHVQTLYRHFRSKQELATATDQDLLDEFRSIITAPNRSGNTFACWRAWVLQMSDAVSQDDGRVFRSLIRQRWEIATVSTQIIAIGHEYEDLLAESLARDFSVSSATGISQARLAAVALWAGSNHVTRRYASEEPIDLHSAAVGVVDSIEALFAHLLKA
jgi:AcrR family transcriptional regulator